MRGRARAFAVGLCLLASAPAAAQTARDATRDEARGHFQRAVALIEAERWADAIAELRRARALRVTAPVMYNLGLAYRAVGRNREALEAFREFVLLSRDVCDAACAARVGAYVRELSAGLGRVEARVEPPAARVSIDGRRAAPGEAVVVDPGRHVLTAEADGYVPETRAVEIRQGDRLSVTLRLRRPAPDPRVSALPPAPPAAHRGTVFESPWFWVGVSAVVAGAGVATYFALHDTAPAYQGSLGTVTDALAAGGAR